MSSSPSAAAVKKQQQVPKAEEEVVVGGRWCSVMEVDPALEEPMLLEEIREKNKDALTYALDPSRRRSETIKSDTAETVWYLSSGSSHHVTGNLDLLTDLTPVANRWIRSILGGGPPLQVLARGSLNFKGIILHDVWYVPDCTMNVVSSGQLDLIVCFELGECLLRRHGDEAVVGQAHNGASGLLEVDLINMSSDAPWYLNSSASQHMTSDLRLITDFVTIRPSHPVQTHTGTKLHVCGKGSVKTGQLSIPNVSYVPGLGENIVSISQLTDTGFTVEFGSNGFTIKERCDGKIVGSGSYGGSQLFHLDSLAIPISK